MQIEPDMKAHSIACSLLACCSLAAAQTARYVSVTATTINAQVAGVTVTNSVPIAEGETGQLVSLQATSLPYSSVWVAKNGLTFPVHIPEGSAVPGTTVRGPASFVMTVAGSDQSALMTVKITPEAFPPDKTVIIPPGTNRIEVALESSTNLVHWASATNGIYGSPDEARFFRIMVQKLD